MGVRIEELCATESTCIVNSPPRSTDVTLSHQLPANSLQSAWYTAVVVNGERPGVYYLLHLLVILRLLAIMIRFLFYSTCGTSDAAG